MTSGPLLLERIAAGSGVSGERTRLAYNARPARTFAASPKRIYAPRIPSHRGSKNSRWRGALASTRGRVRSPDRRVFTRSYYTSRRYSY